MTTNGRVAVVTGASSGIGLVTAKALVKAGWRVIGVGRNAERCASALAELRAAAPGAEVEMLRGDLAIMTDAARLAREIAARTDHIDVLLNNAGGTPRQRVITSEGNEETFAGNHLGHFLLTSRLLPLLKAAVPRRAKGEVRILSTSSSAHEFAPGFDWDNLQSINNFITNKAYCNAKLANVLFTKALAKRLAADGIVVHAMHPGLVATNFASHGDDYMQQYSVDNAGKTISAAEGADTLIWLATSPEAGQTTGGYFFQRAPGVVNKMAEDDAIAERLWKESEALIAHIA